MIKFRFLKINVYGRKFDPSNCTCFRLLSIYLTKKRPQYLNSQLKNQWKIVPLVQ